MPVARDFAQGRTALSIDGVFMGFCDAAGGVAVGEVVSAPIGPGGSPDKHLAGVRYERIEIRGGSGMAPAFLVWLAGALENGDRYDGEVSGFDAAGKAVGGFEFRGAVLTSLQLPALDGASKEPALLAIHLEPEETSRTQHSGQGASAASSKSKPWVAGNFALSISGLEQACARVNRIEPITASRTLMAEQVGAARVIHAEPTSFDVSNLSFTVAESSAEPFLDWHESFVVKGDNGPDRERTGSISLLSADHKTNLFEVSLTGLGIVRAAPEASGPSDAVRRVRVDLYCEQLKLETTAQPPPKDPESPPDPSAGGGEPEPPLLRPGGPAFPRPIVPPDILRPGP
jgi:hypothetical protein